MKPIFRTNQSENQFPLIDWHYRAMSLDGYQGRCATAVAPSIRDISRHYFQKEARRDFISEAILFAAVIVTAAMPLVSGAHAIMELCQAFGF